MKNIFILFLLVLVGQFSNAQNIDNAYKFFEFKKYDNAVTEFESVLFKIEKNNKSTSNNKSI